MPALYDGNGEAAVTFSNDGYVLHGDLFGRGKEDVSSNSGETGLGFTAVRSLNRGKCLPGSRCPEKRLYSPRCIPAGRGRKGNCGLSGYGILYSFNTSFGV